MGPLVSYIGGADQPILAELALQTQIPLLGVGMGQVQRKVDVGAYINFPLNLTHPFTQKWNLSLQRQLSKDWLVSATYIGDKGTHYRSGIEANPAQFVPGATLGNLNQRRLLICSTLQPALSIR